MPLLPIGNEKPILADNLKPKAVNIRRLQQLFQQPNTIEQDDIIGLTEILREHPYFQNAHFLMAKAAKVLDLKNEKSLIQRAAVFAPDRPYLKAYLEDQIPARPIIEEDVIINKPSNQSTESTANQDINKEPAFEFNQNKVETITFEYESVEPSASDSIMAELKNNLAKLQISKEEYHEDIIEETKKAPTTKKAPAKAKKTSAAKATNKVKKETTAQKKAPTATKKPSVSEKAKTLKPEAKEIKTEKASSAEKKKPSPKLDQREQINLIEQFIQQAPQLSKINAKTEADGPVADLSEQLKIDMEDFITENLAIIMEKQGKTDKAIDIYKKLIWKFPQKKAYFATQIEKLKHK